MPTIGQMNKWVTFRQPTLTADTSAGKTAVYDDWFETWASVRKISGHRAFDSGFDGLIDNYDVWVRYRIEMDEVAKNTRVSWNGKDFGIRTMERIDNNGNVQVNGNIYHFVMTAES